MKASRRSRAGVTIVEMLITMAILGMTSGIVVGMLSAAKATWQGAATRVGVTQSLQAATARIVSELRNSSSQLVTDCTAATPSAFSFLSARDVSGRFVTDDDGRPVWQKAVIYYLVGQSGRLVRKEVAGSFTEPLTQAALSGYCDGRGNVCASGVTTFRLVLNKGDSSASLSLACEVTNANGRIDRQSRGVTIFLRN